MGVLCLTGMASHYCLIRAYDLLDAVVIQPLTYLQLVYASIIGITFFGEVLTANMVAGALIVVGAGLFTVWRENVLAKRRAGR
jgi:drug/metabolite transporter (DMT)-like permease